jgi:Transketolase, pyrimidine binding domain
VNALWWWRKHDALHLCIQRHLVHLQSCFLQTSPSLQHVQAAELDAIITGKLDPKWSDALPTFSPEDKPLATRAHSQTMLNAIAPVVPGFWGGSADLAGSNLTLMKMFGDFQKGSEAERNVRFGVREHGMGAIGNGAQPVCVAASALFCPYIAAARLFERCCWHNLLCSVMCMSQQCMCMCCKLPGMKNLSTRCACRHGGVCAGHDPVHGDILHLHGLHARCHSRRRPL